MIYRVVIEKGEDFGYVAHCPAIPGCHSQGYTIEEAIENIKDAIKGCIEVLKRCRFAKGQSISLKIFLNY